MSFSSTGITVTSEDLHNLSGQVSQGSAQIQDQLNALRNQVTAVVGTSWQGAASGQFHQLYEEWQQGAAQVKQALDGISKLLSTAGQQYQQTEDAIKSSMVG